MKQGLAPVPGDFLQSRASGSVTEAWVAFDRFWPDASTTALRALGLVLVVGGAGLGRGGGRIRFGLKAVHQSPSLDKRSVNPEVIVR